MINTNIIHPTFSSVEPARLADRVAFVEQDVSFTPDMSVRQTLLFHSFMREPGTLTRGRDNKGRVSGDYCI